MQILLVIIQVLSSLILVAAFDLKYRFTFTDLGQYVSTNGREILANLELVRVFIFIPSVFPKKNFLTILKTKAHHLLQIKCRRVSAPVMPKPLDYQPLPKRQGSKLPILSDWQGTHLNLHHQQSCPTVRYKVTQSSTAMYIRLINDFRII